MIIGVLKIDLVIPIDETIKERRNVIRSIKDMVRKKFNVSIAETTDDTEITGRAELGIVAVSGDSGHLQSVLNNVLNLIENYYSEMIADYQLDWLQYGTEPA